MLLLAYYGFLVVLPVAVMFCYALVLYAQGFSGPAQKLTITSICAIPFSVAAGFVGFRVLALFFPHYPDELFGGIEEFMLAVYGVVPLSCWVFLAAGWFIAMNDD